MTSYLDSGVDLEGAARHVESISNTVTNTWGPEVVGVFGGFAAGVRIPDGYETPVLMMSTDGVGTKLEIARQSGLWGGVGHDLVAMCVDDLVTTGARPIGFVDYMAVGQLDHERDTAIVQSIAEACQAAGCPLLGGETAEHPGVMEKSAVDLAGAALGVVDEERSLGPHLVREGDVVLGLRSPNFRSNGFSLIRHALGDRVEDLADTLLTPSVIYAPAVLAAVDTGAVHAGAHITGGGLAENLSRSLPTHLGASINTSSWSPPEMFGLLTSAGVDDPTMWETFNMGIGFCLLVDPDRTDEVCRLVDSHNPTIIGVVDTDAGVKLK